MDYQAEPPKNEPTTKQNNLKKHEPINDTYILKDDFYPWKL